MADNQLESLLAEAQKAYQKRDRHTGAQRIDEILQQDFNHPGAWQLLYRLYGAKQPFEDFRRAFAEQYYPDSQRLLRPIAADASAAPSPKKPSFFARLFSRFSRKKGQAQQPAPPGASAPEEPARPAGEQAPVAPALPGSAKEHPASPSLLQSARPRGELGERSAASQQPARPTPAPQRTQPAPLPKLGQPAQAAPAPGRKIRVIVVDDIAETRENIVRSLRFQEEIEVVGKASNGEQGIQLAIDEQPDVILMDVNMPDMDGITATQAIRRSVPYSQVVILTVQDDVDYIRRAMMAGARDYLTKPPMIDELVAAVQQAGQVAHQERSKAPPASAAQVPQAYLATGKIITVYSPRGGSGCTMLAANLAAALHDEENPVVLVDGNLQFGDVTVFYNVQSRNTILDLAPRAEELDAELLESVLVQHSSGIMLLAPPRPMEAENVSGTQFSKVLTYLSALYAYVIVDTAHRLTDITLTALDHSDLVVLITTQDVPSLARTRKFLDLIPLLNLDPKQVLAVMNQYDKRVGISSEKVEEAFNLKIAAILPSDSGTVMPSINRGAPFLLEGESASRPIYQAVLETATAVRQHIDQLEQAAASE